MSFERAVEEVLRHEGGYVRNPNDPGGETNYGISKRQYPDLDIRALTREAAVAIYRRDYWSAIRGDELPPPLALAVFDSAVNQGPRRAVLMLQQALGVRVDGALGPITLGAAQRSPVMETVVNVLVERALRYVQDQNVSSFGRGWLRRLFAIHETALSWQRNG